LSDDIRKFEHVGTQPEALKLAIGEALNFHYSIGAKRKEERLRYLRNYWAKKLEKLPGFNMLTSYSPDQSCGIGTYNIEGIDMTKLSQVLFNKDKIYNITVGIPSPNGNKENVIGMRVTPSIYTSLRELDLFVERVEYYVKKGLPG
jgi:selenocysteine lyase/cysteine desulfurase